MKGKRSLHVWAVLALLVSLGIGAVGATSAMDEFGTEGAAGTAFTYQGQLRDGSGPVNATCDLEFRLWDAQEGGAQVGGTIPLEGVPADLADGDQDTTYTPGTGLSLVGGQFSVNFGGSGTAPADRITITGTPTGKSVAIRGPRRGRTTWAPTTTQRWS